MFNLIITIIAIILVAAVTGASVYYGGKAFNKSGADADAAALINGSQQIAAAYTLAAAQSSSLTTDNFKDYLSSIPTVKGVALINNATSVGQNVNATTGYLVIKTTEDICKAVLSKTGAAGTMPTALSGLYNCAENTSLATGLTDVPAVPTSAEGNYYFGYKVQDVN